MTKKIKSQKTGSQATKFSARESAADDIPETQQTSTTIPNIRLDQLRNWFREALELPGFFNFRVEYPEGRFAYLSPSILRILPKSIKTDPRRTLTLGELLALIEPRDSARLSSDLNRAETGPAGGKTIIERDLRMALDQEGELWMELTMVLQYDDDCELHTIVGVLHDIQRHKDRERELMDEVDEVNQFTDNLPTGSFKTTADGDLLYANRACIRMFGYDNLEDFKKINMAGIYADNEEREKILNHLNEGKSLDEIVWRAIRKDKSEFWASTSGHALYDDEGTVVSFEGNIRDVTQDVVDAGDLKLSIERDQLISECAHILLNDDEQDPVTQVLEKALHRFDASLVGLFKNRVYAGNRLARSLLSCKNNEGVSCESFGKPGQETFYSEQPENWQLSIMSGEIALLNAARAGDLNLFDTNFDDGSVIVLIPLHVHREWYGFIAYLFAETTKIEDSILLSLTTLSDLIGSFLDRQQTEENLQKMLVEKDVLLKEINHRVKNNLALISSLLDLQARRSESSEVKQTLTLMRARVNALAQLHRQLYAHREMDRIDFGDYLNTISSQIVDSFTFDREGINLDVNCQPVILDLDQVMHAALIATELITNSLKHAFPQGRNGEIKVRLNEVQNGKAILEVADNGVGLSDNGNPLTGSFGNQLINMLTDQLDGELERVVDNGTRVRLQFPVAQMESRG